jgi:RHS repeat-associated protein
MVNGLSSTVPSTYDDANRLSTVGAQTYIFDANGNLRNDGQNTYTYDSANRLIAVSGEQLAAYTYSGLGDRLSQTVNGQVTNYTLDLNTGLTQVLSDGTTSYTYGIGRISQTNNSTTEYFLGDALGSVRQLTNSAGEVALAKSYDPYGKVLSSAGSGSSVYAYTGEQQDGDMVYLRTRYLNVNDGRFLSRDTWEGDYNLPMSYNRWQYTYSNPINRIDPTGFNPNCVDLSRARHRGGMGTSCAEQRFNEILQKNGNNGVNALAALFTDSELQNLRGNYAGTTSATRLEWILHVTLGSTKSPLLDAGAKITSLIPPLGYHFQFGMEFPNGCDSGLPNELEDSQFYDGTITWIKQPSQQINHFLTAVSEYYYKGRDITLIIAHEKSVDPDISITDPNTWKPGTINFYNNLTNEVTSADRSHFYKAWHYDTNGMYAERDNELWPILKFNTKKVKNLGDVDPARQGNSLQDLRLSLRGVRFADWVMSYRSSPPSEAGQWLMTNLLLP